MMMVSAPSVIEKYQVIEEIGRGGVGVVYLARDPDLQRHVAIKVIRGDFDEESRERFLRGAQVLSRLQREPAPAASHIEKTVARLQV